MEVPEAMQTRYVERRKQDLEVCRKNLALQKFSELEKVGHQLKGNGVTFGFDDISVIGKRMEVAAAEANVHEMEKALKDLSHWVKQHLN
ncbi:Hpt domain-containing protein [Peredibacter starrii]|uniref:Hpt domain-containing protein n=1 Tax=Peredibacter starrii TaxID=28202 RepID=A0AAX4HQ94_9BACT|nr:Hpt domain-containing protein [Peredibacter starrii]WPU65449.1 Hpt domain-containing protein [Peredibacter starrii]